MTSTRFICSCAAFAIGVAIGSAASAQTEVKQGAWTLTGHDDFSDGGAVRNGATLINQGSIAFEAD